jgi:hypothetical protein
MNEPFEIQEDRIQKIAASFPYPPTPDVSRAVRKRLQAASSRQFTSSVRLRLGWVILLVLLLAAGLLLVPQVRAAVLRIFNIGAITIFEMDESEQLVGKTAVLTATKPLPMAPIVQLGIAEEISLSEATSQQSSPLYLPLYPDNLGEPDHIFLFEPEMGWPPTIVSVWQDELSIEDARLALYQIGAEQFAYKGAPVLERTTVKGDLAIWIEGPHYFRLQNGFSQEWQFIEGNVLIWWHDGLTFRLEGADSLDEAVRIAETLEKVEE